MTPRDCKDSSWGHIKSENPWSRSPSGSFFFLQVVPCVFRSTSSRPLLTLVPRVFCSIGAQWFRALLSLICFAPQCFGAQWRQRKVVGGGRRDTYFLFFLFLGYRPQARWSTRWEDRKHVRPSSSPRTKSHGIPILTTSR